MNKTTDPEKMNCSKCGFPIVKYQKYFKHTDGTIICVDCFKAMYDTPKKK